MRFPPNWVMELVMVTALGIAVVVLIFALQLQEPGGARTDITLERGGVVQMLRGRDGPLAAGDMVLRR